MSLLEAIVANFSVVPLALTLLGTLLGVTVGAIPGLTGAMLIALTIPFTYGMSPVNGIVLMVSMYVGSVSGGLISATLLGMPGAPSAIMTTFDGFPMAQRGNASRALALGVGASLVGGLASWVVLVAISAPLSVLATRFGPWEYFALIMMALVLIASISRGSLVKGLIAGFAGMLLTVPGVDPSAGRPRITFGFHELDAGFALLPVLIGVFAVSQVIEEVAENRPAVKTVRAMGRRVMMTLRDFKTHGVNLLRSSIIGTWIGILPGVGSGIAAIVSYSVAKNMSKSPEKFGKGSEEGIVAAETANNASVGGALVPLIAVGIPGSTIDAILLGALLLHGIQPGPLLYVNNPDVVYAMLSACLLANIAMFAFISVGAEPIARLCQVPKAYLMPIILVFCVIGAVAVANRMFDVWVMLGFGVFGYLMRRNGYPLGPFIIGFVLAPIAERNLRTGLMISGGSYLPLLTRPATAVFIAVAMVMLFWPLWRGRTARSAQESRPPDGS